jgi:two-component system sensor histidine kinase/response regulator
MASSWLRMGMRNRILALHHTLVGDQDSASLEARIFNEVSLITMASLVISLFVNFITQIPYVSLILVVTLLLITTLYINARFYNNLRSSSIIFCIALNLILVVNFFINSGAEGPTILLFMVSFFFTLTIMPKKQYPFWISLNVMTVLAVMLTEYFYPSLVGNSYQSRAASFVDLSFTYLGAVSCVLVILSYIVKSLVREKNKVLAISKDLVSANQSKTKLLSILSHDLRSPLNSIQSFLELLLEYDIDAEEKRMITESLLKETKNTQIMLQNLLSWTKAQMDGGVKVSLTSFPVYRELKVVLEILEISALEKVITIKNEIDRKTYIIADVDMIKLVVRNLITNAVKFTPSGGNILLQSRVEGGFVTLIVQDNGIGMTDKKKEELFTIAAESTYGTNNEKGVGLGLLLCKEFTEMQGGSINFDSEIGKGSAFYITFPICNDANTVQPDIYGDLMLTQ